ncbi:hypothetical protein EYF80_010105 [Liparis tanakae]|uniref:Uncharacterized protein n=1 Tax=Liparis tanakae TaxID=230148 RepID=A0A4Z2IPI1_9TELE|nr:hypothetical protein EYF80_010105 [Liparis tanakae]
MKEQPLLLGPCQPAWSEPTSGYIEKPAPRSHAQSHTSTTVGGFQSTNGPAGQRPAARTQAVDGTQ